MVLCLIIPDSQECQITRDENKILCLSNLELKCYLTLTLGTEMVSKWIPNLVHTTIRCMNYKLA